MTTIIHTTIHKKHIYFHVVRPCHQTKHRFWNKGFCWSKISAHIIPRFSTGTLVPCRSVTASVFSMCGLVVIKSTVVLYLHKCIQNYCCHFFFWCCLLVVYPPIVLAGRGLFSHNMHADCSTPWINIYSLPRSVVINRKAAGEILLSLSLESPATLRVSGQLVRLRRCLVHTCLHSVCVIRAHEYVCVCMRVCGCGNVGRNPTQSKRVNKCYNCIRAVFSLPGL